MFERLEKAPADPILGLTETFNRDPNPKKINLGVGVYKDQSGQTPTLECVKAAEARILKSNAPKTYLPISGSPDYALAVQKLLFGEGSDLVASKRAATAQTPGGTGALRVAADFIKQQLSSRRIWVSDPTWENHAKVFRAAGLEVSTYPYYDAPRKALAEARMLEALESVPEGDVVLFHGCCHNPSGIDPTTAVWQKLAELRDRKGFLPLVDLAYQGFGDGLDEDAAGLRALTASGKELLVASSFSKTLGLYNERVGAVTVVARDADAADRAFGHIKGAVRANYSNPPFHGGAVVTTILKDEELRAGWHVELTVMRDRIKSMRRTFVDGLKAQGISQDFEFIAQQKGMFSFSGLTPAQVRALRENYAIYAVDSGRINVAGLSESNIPVVCKAISEVLAG